MFFVRISTNPVFLFGDGWFIIGGTTSFPINNTNIILLLRGLACLLYGEARCIVSLSERWLSHLWASFILPLLRRIISRDSIESGQQLRSSSRRNIRPANLLQEQLKYEAQSSFDLFKNTNKQQLFESTLFTMDLSWLDENYLQNQFARRAFWKMFEYFFISIRRFEQLVENMGVLIVEIL